MKQFIRYKFILLLVLSLGCKDVYDPPVLSSNSSYLVLEGLLNTNGPTSIFLSRTYKLDDTARLRGEVNATLTVEGDNGFSQSLTEAGGGYYTSPNLGLVINSTYRLRIKTTDGKEYLSDNIVAKTTPPISSVGWKRDGQDVQVFVNTQDPANNTRYYRWEFDETWEIYSYFYSDVIYEPSSNTVRDRVFPEEDVSVCWKNASFHSILIGSSVRLQSDIINEAPIQKILFPDEKIARRYSINVRQYALNPEAYEFYQLMKRNTEEIGSVFGPLPSELRGNIKCISDPSTYVLGYLTAASIEEKRIFINRTELPDWTYTKFCKDSLVANDAGAFLLNFLPRSLIPYMSKMSPAGGIEGYFSSSPDCVDCRVRGGDNHKPNFW
jgi:Domain of unknown function (DUF4249)